MILSGPVSLVRLIATQFSSLTVTVSIWLTAFLTLQGCSTSLPIKAIARGSIIDAVSESGVRARIRIDEIELDPKDHSRETYLYSVSVEDTDERGGEKLWAKFCEPDAENVSKAIPISGYWDEQGQFIDSPTRLTLACTNGVIGKCIRWGYKPWKSDSLKELHLACVRMARADYCGNGIGHTKDGTLIDIFDTVGIQDREKGSMELEAAWSPQGATFLNHPRWGPLASITKECPTKLFGRTSKEFPDISIAEIKARWPETILFNDSYLIPKISDSLQAAPVSRVDPVR